MIRISSGNSETEILEKGAYLSSLVLGGNEVIKKTLDGEQTHGGSAVLIPYAGRVRNASYIYDGVEYRLPKNNGENSIHGFLKDILWSVVSKDQSSVKLSSILSNKGYPSTLETTISYTLEEKGLAVRIEVTNKGNLKAPLLIGFHPYFLVTGDWRIMHDKDLRELNFRDGFFPDGTTSPVDFNKTGDMGKSSFDNCFVGGGNITLESDGGTIVITRENMDYLVIYNGKYTDGRSVAIEPMTGAPDAFNNGIGLVDLEPGASYNCQFSVKSLE